MDRQNRQLTILALVLLVIVAFLVLDPSGASKEPKGDDNAPASHDLFAYTSDEITRLTLTRADGVVQFEKKDGSWRMTEPVSVGAEASKIEAIVDRFETIRLEEAELSGKAVDYGLDEAQRTEVRLERADQSAFTVYIGKDTPAGYKSYAQVPGDAASHVVDSQVGSLVTRSADEFRDRALLPFAAGGARWIRIVQAGVETELRKDESGSWWLGEAGPRADSEKVSSYLSAITLMKVEKFLDGQSPDSVGLAAPFALVSVEDEGGTHTLRIATPDELGANAASGDLPVRMSSADVSSLLGAQAWAAPKLLDVKSWKVDAVSLALGDKKFSASRKEGSWKNDAGEDAKGVDDIVGSLLDLTVDRTTPVTMAGAYGKVSLTLGGGQTVTVQIGNELADGGRVAKEEGGGPAFSVPPAALAAIQDAIEGKTKPRLPESPDEGGGGGMPPGIDIDALLRQAGGGE